jgi:hypothetical protein
MTTRIVTDINGRKHITNEPLLRSSHRETVSNQPEALRLADLIDSDLKKAAHHEEAATELRRLHAMTERTLTDEVIADLWHQNGGFHHHFARAVERWLKGKDHA